MKVAKVNLGEKEAALKFRPQSMDFRPAKMDLRAFTKFKDHLRCTATTLIMSPSKKNSVSKVDRAVSSANDADKTLGLTSTSGAHHPDNQKFKSAAERF